MSKFTGLLFRLICTAIFVTAIICLVVALGALTSCASRRPVVQSVEAIDCAAERTFRADMAETIQRQQHTIDSLTALR